MNFLSLNAPIEKQMYEMNILILKELIMLWNILFVKDCLCENGPVVLIINLNFIPLNYHWTTQQDHHLQINEK